MCVHDGSRFGYRVEARKPAAGRSGLAARSAVERATEPQQRRLTIAQRGVPRLRRDERLLARGRQAGRRDRAIGLLQRAQATLDGRPHRPHATAAGLRARAPANATRGGVEAREWSARRAKLGHDAIHRLEVRARSVQRSQHGVRVGVASVVATPLHLGRRGVEGQEVGLLVDREHLRRTVVWIPGARVRVVRASREQEPQHGHHKAGAHRPQGATAAIRDGGRPSKGIVGAGPPGRGPSRRRSAYERNGRPPCRRSTQHERALAPPGGSVPWIPPGGTVLWTSPGGTVLWTPPRVRRRGPWPGRHPPGRPRGSPVWEGPAREEHWSAIRRSRSVSGSDRSRTPEGPHRNASVCGPPGVTLRVYSPT